MSANSGPVSVIGGTLDAGFGLRSHKRLDVAKCILYRATKNWIIDQASEPLHRFRSNLSMKTCDMTKADNSQRPYLRITVTV